MIAHVRTSRGWRPARQWEVDQAHEFEVWLLDDSADGDLRFLCRLATRASLEQAQVLAYQCGLPVALVLPSTR